MAENRDPAWTWRPSDRGAEAAGLLYEPGNWGDVLKGTWALVLLRSLLETPRQPLRYLDVCAGAPTYALSQAAARRLESLGGGTFYDAQVPFRRELRLASTGRLVYEACAGAGAECTMQVFDAEPERLSRWNELANVTILGVASGEEAVLPGVADLILVDPYDLFDHWGRWLPRVLDASRRSLVLVYLYDKSPRGPGFQDQYARMRGRLQLNLCPEVDAVSGRVASDAVRPRAYHEVILLGPGSSVQPLKEALATETRAVARNVANDGGFEQIRRG